MQRGESWIRIKSKTIFGREVGNVPGLEARVMEEVFRTMYDPELNDLSRRAAINRDLGYLHVVTDPVYGQAVTNGSILRTEWPYDETPLALYCGDGYTLVVNGPGYSPDPSETYDFRVGQIVFNGSEYTLTMRGPKKYVHNGTLAPFFNHRCPRKDNSDKTRLHCFLRGSIHLAIRIPVIYAPWNGLPEEYMTLEYNYGYDFWDTMKTLVKKRADPKRVMWCVCRHREGLSCPLKRGRLMPPPAGKGKKGKQKRARAPEEASRVVVLSDSD